MNVKRLPIWICVAFLSAWPISGLAQFEFSVNSDGSLNLANCTLRNGPAIIPDTTNGVPITSIGELAFDGSPVSSVTIGNDVVTIGFEAFLYCNLTNVIFGTNVANIGESAFESCRYLGDVALPGSVTNVGATAFYLCYSLGSVSVPGSVISIGDEAFQDAQALTNVTIGNGVISLGANLFGYCTNLTSVTIPDSVTNVGNIFWECTRLANAIIGNGVSSIPTFMFVGCTNLTNVVLGTNVTSIGISAFQGDTSLSSIAMPNGVTSIGDDAFFGCSSLTNAMIPDSVVSIGSEAFADDGLISVMIPASATNIGGGAFWDCQNLTGITVDPDNPAYSSMDGGLFDAGQTTLMQYPEAVGGNYFVPSTVTNIASYAFEDCGHLTGIYFPGNAPAIGPYESSGDNLTVYYLPGTKGWSTMYGGFPAVPWLPMAATGGGFGVQSNVFGFNINWASGQTVVVEACTNLSNPVWLPVATNILTGGSCYFSDPQWTNCSDRFYRLVSP